MVTVVDMGRRAEEKAKSELALEGRGVLRLEPGSDMVLPLLVVVDRGPRRCLRLLLELRWKVEGRVSALGRRCCRPRMAVELGEIGSCSCTVGRGTVEVDEAVLRGGRGVSAVDGNG